MEIKCPACKKVNRDSLICTRCECDLNDLNRIIQSARNEIIIGIASLKKGEGKKAFLHAKTSWGLKNSSPAAKLAFLANIQLSSFDEATLWYQRSIRS